MIYFSVGSFSVFNCIWVCKAFLGGASTLDPFGVLFAGIFVRFSLNCLTTCGQKVRPQKLRTIAFWKTPSTPSPDETMFHACLMQLAGRPLAGNAGQITANLTLVSLM